MEKLLHGVDPNLIRYVAVFVLGAIIAFLIRGNATQADARRPRQPIIEVLLDWVSNLGLLVGCLVWSIYAWDKLHPEEMHGIVSVGMWAVVFGLGVLIPLGLPTLIAIAWPRDPINLYLNEKIEHTKAYKIQIWATVIQSLVSLIVLYRWIGSAWNVQFLEDHVFLTVSLVVFSVLMPAFAMLRLIPKHWKARLEMADEVERMRRLHIAEQIKIEALMAQYIALQAIPLLEDTLSGNDVIAQKARAIMGPVLVRQNESIRTIGVMLGHMTGNKHIRIQTPTDEEIYATLEEALSAIQYTDGETNRLAEESVLTMPERPEKRQTHKEGSLYDRINREPPTRSRHS